MDFYITDRTFALKNNRFNRWSYNLQSEERNRCHWFRKQQ